MMKLNQGLDDEELEELDDFLADESIEERSMDVSTLDGFLTAIAIGPRAVFASEWLPWVWDMKEGKAKAQFDNKEHASRISSLGILNYNGVVHAFLHAPVAF